MKYSRHILILIICSCFWRKYVYPITVLTYYFTVIHTALTYYSFLFMQFSQCCLSAASMSSILSLAVKDQIFKSCSFQLSYCHCIHAASGVH